MRKSIYLALLLLFSTLACKKNGGPTGCKIATVSLVPTGGNPQSVIFTYGDDGKLKYVSVGNTTTEYSYPANGLKPRSSIGSGWFVNSFIQFNDAGQAVSKKDTTFNGQVVTNTYLTTFEYNAEGKLINTYKDNNPALSEKFTWTGDNLVKYRSGNTSYILDYYPGKANKDFAFVDLQIFTNMGFNPAKSKNLLKSLTSGGEQLNFLYQFDGSGNIKRWDAVLLGASDTAIRTTQQFNCD